MKLLAIVPATLVQDGQETGILAPVAGTVLLGRLLDRLARVDKLGGIVVTTTDEAQDEAIVAYCAGRGTICHRGPRGDLLGRLRHALKSAEAKGGVMVEAGNALIDPALVDQVANLLEMTDGMLDWIGNTLSETYPRGMEIDGFTTAAIEEADTRCADPVLRQGGPAFLRQNGRIYRPLSLTAPAELARPEVNLKVEGLGDLPRAEAIFAHFAGRDGFSLADVLGFLDAVPAPAR